MKPVESCRLSIEILAFSLCSLAGSANAEPFTYRLSNRPDGAARPPPYGLRLDALYSTTAGHDVFTFNVGHPLSAMFLAYQDGDTPLDLSDDAAGIGGVAFGGRDTGLGCLDAKHRGLWWVGFAYTDNFVSAGAGGSNVAVSPDSAQSQGFILPLSDVGGDGISDSAISLWRRLSGILPRPRSVILT